MPAEVFDVEAKRTLSVRLQAGEWKALERAADAHGQSVSDLVREAITARLHPQPRSAQISAGVGTVVGSLTVQLSSNVLVSGWTSSPFRDDRTRRTDGACQDGDPSPGPASSE